MKVYSWIVSEKIDALTQRYFGALSPQFATKEARNSMRRDYVIQKFRSEKADEKLLKQIKRHLRNIEESEVDMLECDKKNLIKDFETVAEEQGVDIFTLNQVKEVINSFQIDSFGLESYDEEFNNA